MKAIIFAAGLGTRLRPLTDRIPKCLADIGGDTALGAAVKKLAAAGADEIVINTHRFSGMIEDYLEKNGFFGLKIHISREEEFPLETGGGLVKAGKYLRGEKAFFAYNADVYSSVDLKEMYRAHAEAGALATLAVRKRESSRRLVFSREGLLKGREGLVKTESGDGLFGFSGAHVISPDIFGKIEERGVFSITEVYLRLAAAGEKIKAFQDRSEFWLDIGNIERLNAVRKKRGYKEIEI